MKRTNTILKTGLLWALLIGFVGLAPTQSFAQNKKEIVVEKKAKSGDSSSETIVVEVKDGKVFIDGKEVSDVDADGRTIRVQGKNNSGNSTFWVDSSEDGTNVFERIMDGNRMKINGLKRGMAEAELRSRMAPMMGEMMELKSNGNAFELYSGLTSFENGETMNMDMRSRELAMKIRTADGDTSELESELDDLLSEIFASKQDSYQERVDRLREELGELEQKLSDRKANKQDIISKRKKELLGKSDKYDW
ncbi:hypothetical protein HQ496_09705 [bacterium]|nr:hypothetical protein [bacterium]